MKKLLSITTSLILLLTLSACQTKPTGNPEEVLYGYYQDIKDNNIDSAYERLSESTKQNFSKEDFTYWQKILKDTEIFEEAKIEKSSESKSKKFDGNTFKDLVEYKVTEKAKDLYKDKEVTSDNTMYVINDNGSWKIYREENSKDRIASSLVRLSIMYFDGESKTQDLNRAETLLNTALSYSENVPGTYYALGLTYYQLKRYDEALDATNKYILEVNEKEIQSYGYNVLGLIYMKKNLMDNARDSFNKAIELNPNNEKAKTNLQKLK
ncbi:MAG: tetratricopeptide repeat protein [Clostridiaceae bacterium]